MISSVLIAIIVIALFFEFTNGFHDAANVVATPIATKSLTPYQAIALAAFFNFLGAFFWYSSCCNNIKRTCRY